MNRGTKPSWEDAWTLPREVSDVEVAFPARGMDYAPTREQAESALAQLNLDVRRDCLFFANALFAGRPTIAEVGLYDGVDGELAFRHLRVVAGCYAFKHEHKMAALAYLASRWLGHFGYEQA